MRTNVTATTRDFFTIKDVCFDCWCRFVFSNDKYDDVDAIREHPGLHERFEQLCTFDRSGGATCVFCSASRLPAASTVKDDVLFVPNEVLRMSIFDEWQIEELFARMAHAADELGSTDKVILDECSVSRGFNLCVLAVYFARTFGRDKRYPLTYSKRCIKLNLTDNVLSHFNSMWNTRIAIASDFIAKTCTISNSRDDLTRLIGAYFQFSAKYAEETQRDIIDLYKNRLNEVVITILENEFDTFVSDYQALFRYIDRIYHQDRQLFEQLLRLQIHVSYDVEERLKITKFQISRDVMTFTGFYNKFARGISQTVWMLHKNVKSELSVEECLCMPLQALCSGDGYKFMASGREDCDVRTTGTGRKFCVEIYNCKRDPFLIFRLTRMLRHDLTLSEEHITEELPILHCIDKIIKTNDTTLYHAEATPKQYYFLKSGIDRKKVKDTATIEITKVPRQTLVDAFNDNKGNAKYIAAVKFYGLRVGFENRSERQVIQNDAENKNKIYACLVFSKDALNFDDIEAVPKGPLTIKQRNPTRTSHRKNQSERERTVHEIKIDLLHPRMMLIHLKTQAGTYVKEFVNGDFGRTTPSISSMLGGSKVYVTHLDVVGFC